MIYYRKIKFQRKCKGCGKNIRTNGNNSGLCAYCYRIDYNKRKKIVKAKSKWCRTFVLL